MALRTETKRRWSISTGSRMAMGRCAARRIAAVLGEKQQAVDLLREAIAQGLPFTLSLHRTST